MQLLPCSFEPSHIAWVSLKRFEKVFLAAGEAIGEREAPAHDDPSRSERRDIEPAGGNVHVMTSMINIVARSAALGSALGVLFTGAVLFGQHDGTNRADAHLGTVSTAATYVVEGDDRWG
ncbi:hypothetical protein [Streptomyces olivochromogenes]|uniref:hypothetical protein n=1 Tax=Streptomyces olivochromogenes TaxID=1963 RepID=UPI001F3728D2|nr:hypothetical protein [Streptomyces olivochromogenes]MCF3131974.1 hypothetical protein [Streptomyces olivochromogenes]